MNKLPFMQWAPADYKADTSHLTLEEDGLYRRLLDELWIAKGSLQFDTERLARRLRITTEEFEKLWPYISEFFAVEEGGILTNSRVSRDWKRAQAIVKKRQNAGKKSAAKRKKTKNNSTHAQQVCQHSYDKPEPEVLVTLKGNKELPPDGALALETLRAAVGGGDQGEIFKKFSESIVDWQDGIFYMSGPYALDQFSNSLRGPLAQAKVSLALQRPALAASIGGE